ncbi:MAG: putative sensor domain DACNV-containing protein, partial [Polyangiales bacterium]
MTDARAPLLEGAPDRAAKRRLDHVFPPALVPLLRDRLASGTSSLDDVDDAIVEALLAVVFFAGLETNEHAHNPIRVVFVGHSPLELALAEVESPDAPPSYRWRTLPFAVARPFSVAELVKLAVAKGDEQLYTQVRCVDGELVVSGLAREGTRQGGDSYLKIVAARTGGLSIGCGQRRLFEYERGSVVTCSESLEFFAPPVRAALETAAAGAGLRDEVAVDYLDAVRALVGEMVAHGHGGIVIVSTEERPELPEASPYRIVRDSSIASLLRIARVLRERRLSDARTRHRPDGARHGVTFSHLLHDAFIAEAERSLRDFGALTAIDGATVLNRALALAAFGVVLPVAGGRRVLATAGSREGTPRALDLANRGTRHAAGALYADEHPGSV